MEIQQLKHFLAAVEHGNLARAADTLGMTQSGLSRSIKSLEDAVGVPLLIRTTKGVEASEIGRTLVPRAAAVLNQVTRAGDELTSARKSLVGHAAIGLTSNFAHYVFSDLATKLCGAFPGVELSLQVGSFTTVLAQLKQAEVDLVFALARPQYIDEEIIVDELYIARSDIYTHPTHPLVRKVEPSLADLTSASWALSSDMGFLTEFNAYFLRKGCKPPRPRVATNSFSLLVDAAINMRLLTVLPRRYAETKVSSGELISIRMDAPTDFARVCLLYRPESPQIPIINSTIKFLHENAKILQESLQET